ncbi:hypothetical protein AAQV58_26725, partial [Klebsiella pneumoniae]
MKTGIADVFAQVEVSPEDLRLQAVAELTQDENTPLRGVFADEADLIDRIAGGVWRQQGARIVIRAAVAVKASLRTERERASLAEFQPACGTAGTVAKLA